MKAKTRIRTNAEQKAFEREIEREVGRQMKAYNKEVYAAIAWVLYESEGYRLKKISRVLKQIRPLLDELNERYELERYETVACTERLRRAGIDLDEILTDDDWLIAHAVSNGEERNE